MRISLPFILLAVLTAAGCVRSEVPILADSEIEHGRLVTPGVYLCVSCEDVLAVGWDSEAMLHTFDGLTVRTVAMAGRRLAQIETDDGFALFWATVDDGRRFTIYDLKGPVETHVQERYGIGVEYLERYDFHSIAGEPAAVRRFMEEYARKHVSPSGTYEFVIAADVTQQELEECKADCGEMGGGDFETMIRGCVALCVGKR